MDSKRISEFAIHCAINHSVHSMPNEGSVRFEIQCLKEAHMRMFGSEIPNSSIVMIVMRGMACELADVPGKYHHVMGNAELPAWVSELLAFLSIDIVPTDINGHRNLPCWCM